MDFIRANLVREHSQLARRLERLLSFVGSKDFIKLDKESKEILRLQVAAMEDYKSILEVRLKRIDEKKVRLMEKLKDHGEDGI
jgi:hypothetical protein